MATIDDAPDKIYLQWHCRECADEVYWCVDRIDPDDVLYFRADYLAQIIHELYPHLTISFDEYVRRFSTGTEKTP